jgi:hypothetical protein
MTFYQINIEHWVKTDPVVVEFSMTVADLERRLQDSKRDLTNAKQRVIARLMERLEAEAP